MSECGDQKTVEFLNERTEMTVTCQTEVEAHGPFHVAHRSVGDVLVSVSWPVKEKTDG